MSTLSIHRRDRRARAPKGRKRRNLDKFIPNADSDFAFMAQSIFLSYLRLKPAAYGVTPEQVEEIASIVAEFRNAVARATLRFGRSPQLVMRKDIARRRAEEIIRRTANVIRANPEVSDTDKVLLRLKKKRHVKSSGNGWQQPPLLRFVGSGNGVAQAAGTGNGSGVHVLTVRSHAARHITGREIGQFRRTKPDGAARLELFVDLVPVGQEVPRDPAALTGRAWYLRSFTTSRIEASYPIPSEPMLVVYWARWADGRGGVGRFSEPCVARIEGWTRTPRPALPHGAGDEGAARRIEQKIVFVQVERIAPAQLPHYAAEEEELTDRPREIETVQVKRIENAV